MQSSTFQSFVLTKNFPPKTKPIKKKPTQQKPPKKLPLTSNSIQIIVKPEKCLQLIKYYHFSGFIFLDHLSIDKDGQSPGYYGVIRNVKRIIGVSMLEENLLEVSFVDIKQPSTPFEFFEERMKSLGNQDALNFTQTIKACLTQFQNCQSLVKPPQADDFERYKKFKQSIKAKINELLANEMCFIIIFLKTDPNSEEAINNTQHYISYPLLKLIGGVDQNFLFDCLREGFPDIYNFGGNTDYYEQMDLLFRKMFLNAKQSPIFEVTGKNGESYKGTIECETLSFTAENYQEIAGFHILNFDPSQKHIKLRNMFFKPKLEVEPQKKQEMEGLLACRSKEKGRIHEYYFHSEQFTKKFYPKRIPLNCLEENQDKVCQYKPI